jgi:hypothetical protein
MTTQKENNSVPIMLLKQREIYHMTVESRIMLEVNSINYKHM